MLKYNYCTYKGDNQMTENTYILAVDPGNEKTGIAIVSPSGEMICRKIISSNTFNKEIGRNHKITTSLIDESHSTEEARKLYWQYNPPTGWRKIIPTSMQFPPEPVDDLTALVIGLRYTKQLAQNEAAVKEETMSSSELEEKRLHAMEQLYGKGDNHDE